MNTKIFVLVNPETNEAIGKINWTAKIEIANNFQTEQEADDVNTAVFFGRNKIIRK